MPPACPRPFCRNPDTVDGWTAQHGVRRLMALALIILLALVTPMARAQQVDFSGDWQSFWRGGSAVLNLSQAGDLVTGTYAPGEGVVEGAVEGRVLRGTWEQPGASGAFVFALSEDGQMMTGRFGNGEYWNGFRDNPEAGSAVWQLDNGTPRQTLRSVLLAMNAATYSGDAGALRQIPTLVSYAGSSSSAGEEARRRALMFDILDMSTLRLVDVPEAAETPDQQVVRFDIGPAGVAEKTTLIFRADSFGRWRLVLPAERDLADERARLLAAMGHDSMADLASARADSPRAAMRHFIQGVKAWDDGGRDQALAVMDLTAIPARLHPLEGRSTPISSGVSSTVSPMSFGRRCPTIPIGACPTSTISTRPATSPSRV